MRSHHNVGASVLFCIAHMYEPPMAQFNGITINIWKNRKVNSNVSIHKLMTIFVQLNGDLHLTYSEVKAMVTVIESAESGGTIL